MTYRLIASLDSYREKIPDWVGDWFLYLGIGLLALLLLYCVFYVLRAMHRRAYNLTKTETAKAGQTPPPDFLTVDKEARAAAIKRGDDYVRPADREALNAEADATPVGKRWSWWAFLSRVGALIAGVGHVGVLIVSLMASTRDADVVWQEISASERLAAVVTKYWPGFLLAGLVIIAELVRFISTKKKQA